LPNEAALQAAKKRGQRPGNPGIAEAAKLGRAALKANARRFAANMRPIIDEIMRAGGVQMHKLSNVMVATKRSIDMRHSPARSGKACLVRLGHDLGVRPHIAKIICR
jgi:hypothetical protein